MEKIYFVWFRNLDASPENMTEEIEENVFIYLFILRDVHTTDMTLC